MTTDTPRTDASKPKLTRESYDENWNMITDTPRTDACPHCGSPRISPLCAYFTCKADTTQRDEDKRTHLCREREKSQKLEAEVERLKELVMEAARKGDELLEPYRLRAEKAETLLKQIHSFAEALNPNKK